MAKVSKEFDPFKRAERSLGIRLKASTKRAARQEIMDFVLDSVLEDIGDGKSPVKGGAWRRQLTPEYRKGAKRENSSVTFANLELFGDLLDALKVKKAKGDKLSLEVSGAQAGKAEGNNRGTYEKSRPIKGGKFKREFIPKANQTFKDEIWDGIEAIVQRHAEDEDDG